MTTIRHGSRTRYNKGCRCDACVNAHNTYQRAYMASWRAAHPRVYDVDPVAVERACFGDPAVTLNRAEVALAFALLDRQGRTAREIADRLRVTQRTVERWRSGQIARPNSRRAAA